jgi:hypothetical protein
LNLVYSPSGLCFPEGSRPQTALKLANLAPSSSQIVQSYSWRVVLEKVFALVVTTSVKSDVRGLL